MIGSLDTFGVSGKTRAVRFRLCNKGTISYCGTFSLPEKLSCFFFLLPCMGDIIYSAPHLQLLHKSLVISLIAIACVMCPV